MALSKETQNYINKSLALSEEKRKLRTMKANLDPKELASIKAAKIREKIPGWKDIMARKATAVKKCDERIAKINVLKTKANKAIEKYQRLITEAQQ